MNESFKENFLLNGKILTRSNFLLPTQFDYCIYEVIRIIRGVPLFLYDHFERFCQSVAKMPENINITFDEFYQHFEYLLKANNHADGNVRIALYKCNEGFEFYMYYIAHSYPGVELYQNGVQISCYKAVRPDPNVKMFHQLLKKDIDNILKNNNIYEVLLINENDLVTEGSRSNVFFIKNEEIYTAPGSLVLKGVTRKHVITSILNLGYRLHECEILVSEIASFDASFLTGTSPKVLPINKIDHVSFRLPNKVLNSIIQEYNKLIEENITRFIHT